MLFRALALGVLVVGRSVWAADDAYPAPPMVSVPDEPEAGVAPTTTMPMPKISNAPLEPETAEQIEAVKAEPPGRMKRVGLSLAFGAASGAAVGLVGGLIGLAVGPGQLQPMGNGWSLAALGFCLGAPVGVLIAGWLFDGNGAWWATLLGDAAGALIGLAAVGFGGPEGGAALFTLPLVGSVLAYEMTSDVTVAPTVSLLRGGGGTVGLVGRF